jgi:16S rRNA (cytosine1402-N4)-methyltransferase
MITLQTFEFEPRSAHARSRLMPTAPSDFHRSVLLAETVEALQPVEGRLFVDGTLGGGGHAEALLHAGARVIGFDRDAHAVAYATRRLAWFGERFTPVHASFSEAADALTRIGVDRIDGALLDLGVSSHQLESAERGFSFMREGPLDMRMDRSRGATAADLVNTAPEETLEDIFRRFGEERAARRMARAIAIERRTKPLRTTQDLVHVLEGVQPRRGKIHPATRAFQALRIAVNDELGSLERGLAGLAELLQSGARFAVITFHSLEDRIVKDFFAERSREWLDRPEWPAPRANEARIFRRITRRPITPSDRECRENSRARSAKLRVVERL